MSGAPLRSSQKASQPVWRRVVAPANLLHRALHSSATAEEIAIMHNKVEREAGEIEGSAHVVETALPLGAKSFSTVQACSPSLRQQHASNLS